MHKVPLGLGIFLLVCIFTAAITYNTESLWVAFGINLVLIVIGVIKAIGNYSPSVNKTNNTSSDQYSSSSNQNRINLAQYSIPLREIDQGLKRNDPEAIYQLAMFKAKYANTAEDRIKCWELINEAAQKGSVSAKIFLNKISTK